MSSFGPKRKARAIKVDHVDDEDDNHNELEQPIIKPMRKPMRSSGLRKSIVQADADGTSSKPQDATELEDDNGPAVVRPSASRTNSTKSKRRPQGSRISFGGDTSDPEESSVIVPKKSTRPQETPLRKNIALKGLPMRSMEPDEESRNIYSKEYLAELQSSTPVTPQNISSRNSAIETDDMELDPSELDGAVIVDSEDTAIAESSTAIPETRILTETEIRERKDRRARLANEPTDEDIIRLSPSSDGNDDGDGSMLSLLTRRKKAPETRLVREDEDLGEGFDEYVEDGGIALGRKAEREARIRRKREIEEMITAAEGISGEDSSDGEAERRIAFEAVQSRAAMEGLEKPKGVVDREAELLQVPGKLAPIPTLGDCTGRVQEKLAEMREVLAERKRRLEELRGEKEEIFRREEKVQALLDDAGRELVEALGKLEGSDVRRITEGEVVSEFAAERGLESLGAKNEEDVEMEM